MTLCDGMKKKIVFEYMYNPHISQRQLATKYNIPYNKVVNLLRSKKNGLTPFQRYKRNRDRILLQKWTTYDNKIKGARVQRNLLADQYGLAQGSLYQLVKKTKSEGVREA